MEKCWIIQASVCLYDKSFTGNFEIIEFAVRRKNHFKFSTDLLCDYHSVHCILISTVHFSALCILFILHLNVDVCFASHKALLNSL